MDTSLTYGPPKTVQFILMHVQGYISYLLTLPTQQEEEEEEQRQRQWQHKRRRLGPLWPL